jgi:hypothetical protein
VSGAFLTFLRRFLSRVGPCPTLLSSSVVCKVKLVLLSGIYSGQMYREKLSRSRTWLTWAMQKLNATISHRTRAQNALLFGFIFFLIWTCKQTCWLWAPTSLKTVHYDEIFSYLTMNNIAKILFLLLKNTKFNQKLFLCYVAKPRVGPINSQRNNFKWGNIFAGVCTLVFSLWVNYNPYYQLLDYQNGRWQFGLLNNHFNYTCKMVLLHRT